MAAHALDFSRKAISPWLEMGAYEALWDADGASFKSLAQKFASHPSALPSDFIPDKTICAQYADRAIQILKDSGIHRFGVRINGAGEYPEKLRDAEHPIEMLYFQGHWNLTETRCVAVVGTRNPSHDGVENASKIAAGLAQDGFTIVSGLAGGIDTASHGAAIRRGVPTIAVIGTPLWLSYPKSNAPLQRHLAKEHLVISQVPICSYSKLDYRAKPRFFPERNVTMSALTEATIIIEASDTSGTLTQARAAIKQKRKLFILESCFRKTGVRWPATYEKRGAIRVKTYTDILKHLG
jgi:DNA processing protein